MTRDIWEITLDENGGVVHIDAAGQPILRSKFTHPYSYDEHVIWRSPDYKEGHVSTITWSDRMLQQRGIPRHNELSLEIFGDKGQYWDRRDPSKIETFLQRMWDLPDLKLVQLVEGCNQSSGYPYWRFDGSAD